MATIHQYFETDFDYALRVKIKYEANGELFEGALFYDVSALSSFLAFYFHGFLHPKEDFLSFLKTLNLGVTKVKLDGGIVLPSWKFPGQLRIEASNQLMIEYQLCGDPTWRNLKEIHSTGRVFIYSETNLSEAEIIQLQTESEALGHNLQFRDEVYVKGRTQGEKPLAFISHDSKDKDNIARRIALNLQRKICPVWYDEFSLSLGDNLRESIEKGLRECNRCVLILSKNFFGNKGWGKKEFESIFTREILEERQLVLPVWCGVTKHEVYEYSPSLLNVKGVDWIALGEEEVCRQIYVAVSKA
jgi:hypothetical protein